MQPIGLPGDVVVGVHNAADNVEDEEEQEDEPVGGVFVAFALGVADYEDGEADYCFGLGWGVSGVFLFMVARRQILPASVSAV